jgi:hypothetical protein
VRNAYGENCKTLQSRYKLFHLKHTNYRVLMGKPEGKRPLGRPRCRWEYGIRMDLREIGWGSVDWIKLAQDRDR